MNYYIKKINFRKIFSFALALVFTASSLFSPYAQAQKRVQEFQSSRVKELKSLNSQTPKLPNSKTPQLSNYVTCLQKYQQTYPEDQTLQKEITQILDFIQNRLILAGPFRKAVTSDKWSVTSNGITDNRSLITDNQSRDYQLLVIGSYQGDEAREHFVMRYQKAVASGKWQVTSNDLKATSDRLPVTGNGKGGSNDKDLKMLMSDRQTVGLSDGKDTLRFSPASCTEVGKVGWVRNSLSQAIVGNGWELVEVESGKEAEAELVNSVYVFTGQMEIEKLRETLGQIFLSHSAVNVESVKKNRGKIEVRFKRNERYERIEARSREARGEKQEARGREARGKRQEARRLPASMSLTSGFLLPASLPLASSSINEFGMGTTVAQEMQQRRYTFQQMVNFLIYSGYQFVVRQIKGQDAVFLVRNLLIGGMKPNPNSNDPIKTFQDLLVEAEAQDNSARQAYALEQLGDIVLQQQTQKTRDRDYTRPALFYTQALAVVENRGLGKEHAEKLLKKLEQVEAEFLKNEFGIKLSIKHQGTVTAGRQLFRNLRKRIREQIEKTRSNNNNNDNNNNNNNTDPDNNNISMQSSGQSASEIARIQKDITDYFIVLIKYLIQESFAALGTNPPNPESYAIVSLGSMAREETAPYSDLEFAILLDKEDKELKKYFRNVVRLAELKTVSLGETEFPILQQKQSVQTPLYKVEGNRSGYSFTPTGFMFDSGGNTPLGNGLIELIGTAEQLAQIQAQEDSAYEIAANALGTVSLIMGNEELIQRYENAVKTILDEPIAHPPLNPLPSREGVQNNEGTRRQLRALQQMEKSLKEFDLKLDVKRAMEKAFNVKRDLYRLPSFVIRSLGLYYGAKSKNILQLVQELSVKGVISSEGAKNLDRILRQILDLRVRVQTFYGTEKEYILHPESPILQSGEKYYVMSKDDIRTLSEIYRVLTPLHQVADQFVKTQGKENGFAKYPLYDPEPEEKGKDLEVKNNLREAKKAYAAAVSVNPTAESWAKLREVSEKLIKQERAMRLQERIQGFFIGREALLKAIHAGIETQTPDAVKIVALVGMGGVGKSQLAVQYALNHHQEYDFMWWLSGENLISGFMELAEELALSGVRENAKEVLPRLFHWFRSSVKRWLLIYDNAEDVEAVNELMPHGNGTVIVTSRNPKWKNVVEVEPMERAESMELLQQLTSQKDEKQSNEIAELLGDLPLALIQAGHYMKQTGTSYADYKKLFEDSRGKLWGEEKKETRERKKNKAIKTIDMTWNLSMHQVTKESSEARGLLEFMSFLAADNIPRELLLAWMKEQGKGEAELDQALSALQKYSLISFRGLPPLSNPQSEIVSAVDVTQISNPKSQIQDYNPQLISLHRLLQTVVRDRMNLQEKKGILETGIKLISQLFTYLPDKVETWQQSQPYVAHAENLCEHAEKAGVKMYKLGMAYNQLGMYKDQVDAQYSNAQKYYQKSLKISLAALGEKHPSVAKSYNNLGEVYRCQGKYDEAIEYYQKSLKISLAALGANHPNVATSYNNLGNVYHAQGKYDEAIKYYQNSLKISLAALGENHPDIGTSYNNLGEVYRYQGKYDEAIKYFQKSLRIRLAALGENHPSVGASYNNLGSVYKARGKYDEAIGYYQKSLKISLAMLGENHPDVGMSYNNLGSVYIAQGKYDEAIEYYQKALKIWRAALGENHPDVGKGYSNLGGMYKAQGKYDEAIKYSQKALKIWRAALGENHPDVGMSYNNLGSVYIAQGKYDEAIEYFQKALKISLAALGENHPSVGESYNNLGGVYHAQGNYDEAIKYFQKSLKIKLAALGENHPEVGTSYNNLGIVYKEQGKNDEAIEYFQKALKIWRATLGENHPNTKAVNRNLQNARNKQSNVQNSYVDPQALADLGRLYYLQGNYDRAMELFVGALEISISLLGRGHQTTQIIWLNLLYLLSLSQQKNVNALRGPALESLVRECYKDLVPPGVTGFVQFMMQRPEKSTESLQAKPGINAIVELFEEGIKEFSFFTLTLAPHTGSFTLSPQGRGDTSLKVIALKVANATIENGQLVVSSRLLKLLAQIRPRVSTQNFIMLIREIIRHEVMELSGLSHDQALEHAHPILLSFLNAIERDGSKILAWLNNHYLVPRLLGGMMYNPDAPTLRSERSALQRRSASVGTGPQSYERRPTRGYGDCSFHAIFGEWNGREYAAQNAPAMRQELYRFLSSFKSPQEMPLSLRKYIYDVLEHFYYGLTPVYHPNPTVQALFQSVRETAGEQEEEMKELKQNLLERILKHILAYDETGQYLLIEILYGIANSGEKKEYAQASKDAHKIVGASLVDAPKNESDNNNNANVTRAQVGYEKIMECLGTHQEAIVGFVREHQSAVETVISGSLTDYYGALLPEEEQADLQMGRLKELTQQAHERLMANLLNEPEFYLDYLRHIQEEGSDYYLWIQELKFLAVLSGRTVRVMTYNRNKGKYEERETFEPDSQALNESKFEVTPNVFPVGGEVVISHNGINHYERLTERASMVHSPLSIVNDQTLNASNVNTPTSKVSAVAVGSTHISHPTSHIPYLKSPLPLTLPKSQIPYPISHIPKSRGYELPENRDQLPLSEIVFDVDLQSEIRHPKSENVDDHLKQKIELFQRIEELSDGSGGIVFTHQQKIKDELETLGLEAAEIIGSVNELLRLLIEPEQLLDLAFPLPKKEKEWNTEAKIFGTLMEVLRQIKEIKNDLLKNPTYMAITQALKSIEKIYYEFIERVLKANPNDRPTRLTGLPRLKAAEIGHRIVKPDPAEQLLIAGKFGAAAMGFDAEDFSDNEMERIAALGLVGGGNHKVVEINGVHFKVWPDNPGIEYAVDSLNKIVSGEGSTPSLLLRIEQGKNHYPLLASRTVEGMRLDKLLKTHPEFLQSLDPVNYTAMIILSLLTDPGDSKAENIMAHIEKDEQGQVKSVKLVGIDNDVAFVDPVSYHTDSKDHRVAVLNVLYTLPQMNKPISPVFKQRFLSLSAEEVVFRWLQSLNQKNMEYELLLKQKTFNQDYLEKMQLPIWLVPGTAEAVYWKIKAIQQSLSEDKEGKMTHQDLVNRIDPIVGAVYERAVKIKKQNPIESYGFVYAGLDAPINYPESSAETILGETSEEVESQISLFARHGTQYNKETPDYKKDRSQRIRKALEEWIGTIPFSKLSSDRQKLFFAELKNFEELQVLKIKGAQHLTSEQLIDLVQKLGELEELYLDGANLVTEGGILELIRKRPKIKLVLGKNQQLDSKAWAEIVKAGGNLWIALENDRLFHIDKKSAFTDNALHTRRIDILQTLLHLGADPKEVNEKGETLLHRASRFGYKELAEFFLLMGSDPKAVEKERGNSCLHTAVDSGQEEMVRFWLEYGLYVNSKNTQGETPMHRAAMQGFLSIMKLLLEYHANPKAQDNNGNTPIHCAAQYGQTKALKVLELVSPEDKTTLLMAKGLDTLTALHLAAKQSNADTVEYLIKQGADVNAVNDFKMTPLHFAAAHQGGKGWVSELKSFHYLIQAGADPNLENVNGDNALTRGIKYGQDHIALYLLDPNLLDHLLKEESKGVSVDPLKYYETMLNEAEAQNDPVRQAYALERLGDLALQEQNRKAKDRDYTRPAVLYNQALAVIESRGLSDKYVPYLLKKLERVEGEFVYNELGIKLSSKYQGFAVGGRKALRDFRKNVKERYLGMHTDDPMHGHEQSVKEIQRIQKEMTEYLVGLFKYLIQESFAVMGQHPPAPESYAIISLGSMAREETAPYSDLEFAILLDQDDPELKQYFYQVTRLLQLKIINLGETSLSVLQAKKSLETQAYLNESKGGYSFTPAGFMFDAGGNTPLSPVVGLIGTPEQLAQIQQSEDEDGTLEIVRGALGTVSLIMGNEKLIQRYERAVKKIMDASAEEGISGFLFGKKLRERRALQEMNKALKEFKLKLDMDRAERVKMFNVKRDLYRLPGLVIRNLGLYYGASGKNTLALIEELAKKKILSSEGAKNLAGALRQILDLRVRVQLYYGTEKEYLLHHQSQDTQSGEKYWILGNQEIQLLAEIYKVLIPLQKAAEKFVAAEGKQNPFAQDVLYDKDQSEKGALYRDQRDHETAEKEYEIGLAITQDPLTRSRLGAMRLLKGNTEEAEPELKKALTELEIKYPKKDHPDMAAAYNNFGLIYDSQKKYDQAREYFQKAVKIWEDLKHPDSSKGYHNIGKGYQRQGKYDQAIEYYEKALKIRESALDVNDTSLEEAYSNLAIIYANQGKNDHALTYFEKVLNSRLSRLGKNHLQTANSYINIGIIYNSQKKHDQAMKYHLKAQKILLSFSNQNQPEVAKCTAINYSNLGNVYRDEGKDTQALECQEKALKIALSFSGKDGQELAASCYTNLGNIYLDQKNYDQAIEYYQKALEIRTSILGKDHPKTKLTEENLKLALEEQEEANKVIVSFRGASLESLVRERYKDLVPPGVTGFVQFMKQRPERGMHSKEKGVQSSRKAGSNVHSKNVKPEIEAIVKLFEFGLSDRQTVGLSGVKVIALKVAHASIEAVNSKWSIVNNKVKSKVQLIVTTGLLKVLSLVFSKLSTLPETHRDPATIKIRKRENSQLLVSEIIRHEVMELGGLSHNQALERAHPILLAFLNWIEKQEARSKKPSFFLASDFWLPDSMSLTSDFFASLLLSSTSLAVSFVPEFVKRQWLNNAKRKWKQLSVEQQETLTAVVSGKWQVTSKQRQELQWQVASEGQSLSLVTGHLSRIGGTTGHLLPIHPALVLLASGLLERHGMVDELQYVTALNIVNSFNYLIISTLSHCFSFPMKEETIHQTVVRLTGESVPSFLGERPTLAGRVPNLQTLTEAENRLAVLALMRRQQ